jgi:predicted dehydrogenase
MNQPLGIGVIGVGNISGQYFQTLKRLDGLKLVAVADVNPQAASQAAAEQDVPAVTVGELLADSRIGLVINLTIPAVHADLDRQILASGKHVYAEKPLGLSLAEARTVMDDAAHLGLRVGSAPDTFMGTGIQSSLDLVESGQLGQIFAATALWGAAGPELWHPNPRFFYQAGGGPVLDMGPYYLTALVVLLGPVRQVQAQTSISQRQRKIGAGPMAGQAFPVEVPTYAAAILTHATGTLSTVTLSFETWGHNNQPYFELFGTNGSLRLPDPNTFEGVAQVYDANGVSDSAAESTRQWRPVPVTAGFANSGRGIGVLDMAESIAAGRPHRASGDLALHVMEIMAAITSSGGQPVDMTTTVDRPPLIPLRHLAD